GGKGGGGVDRRGGGKGGGEKGGGGAVREGVRPRARAEERDDLLAPRDVAAARAADRLAERPGDDVDLLADAVMLRCPPAAGPDDADRARVVDHDERVVPLREAADLAERAGVAVH